MDKHPIDVASEIMGSQVALASALGVTKAAVSQWKDEGRRVPAEHCPAIERLTAGVVRCEHLRPDVAWDVLRAQDATVKRLKEAVAQSAEPSEAPAAAEKDAYGPVQDETVKRLKQATQPLRRRTSDREGPGARDERLRYGHPGSVNRERHAR